MMAAHPPLDIHSLKISTLSNSGALSDFDSGEDDVDSQIERCCERHQKYRYRVFCAVTDDGPLAYGFYCLSVLASDAKYLSEEITRTNDGRNYVPFIYVNYIAVRKEYQNQKIGTILLGDLLSRCGRIVRDVGVYGIALNALTQRVMKLYERYGFRQYGESSYPLMILPTQSLIDLTAGEYP